jgi:hypothetical protein
MFLRIQNETNNGRRSPRRYNNAAGGLEIRDTADWKSALRVLRSARVCVT